MDQNHCEHIHPDGARCQAHPQTGRSFCFFHDPKQERNRDRARRNGGFMRGRYIDSESEPSAMAALNLAPIEVEKVDDVVPIIVEHLNLYRQGKITKDDALVIFKGCNGAVCAFREKRQAEHEARPAAEAARAVAERQIVGFQAAGSAVNSTESAKPEEPIIIDASTPWDPRQFGGKKPRISCVVPVFTSMRTGKIIDVNEPNPLDPPEHMLRDEFRRKPAAPTAPAGPQATPPEHTLREEFPGSTVPGTKNIPCFVPRREPNASDRSEGLREGVRNQESSAVGAAKVAGHGFSHDGPRPSQLEDSSGYCPSLKGGGTEARQRWESRTEDQHRSAEACPGEPWASADPALSRRNRRAVPL